MTRLQIFHEQEVRIENDDCNEITSEGKDTIIIGSLRRHFKQYLTSSDEDLVDILVDLSKENIVFKIGINEGLNVSDVGDKFPKVFRPETGQKKTAAFKDFTMSKKQSEAKGSITEDVHLKGYFSSKTAFKPSKNIMIETEIRVLEKGLNFASI